MAKSKQLPAGKSKAELQAAAKRKAAANKAKKPPAKNPVKPKKGTSVAEPPLAAPSAQAPVSSPTGSLISPETWEADQARLQSAAADADTVDELNQTESDADTQYTTAVSDATKAAAERKLELSKQKSEFVKSKPDDYKNLSTTMAYRGAGRSSAANRGVSKVITEHSNIDNEYKKEEAAVGSYVTDVESRAKTAREATKGFVAKRRGTLANRAASQGVYSVGSAPVAETGVNATTMLSPTPAAKKAKAKANTSAAKRRIAKAKKGKK